MTNEAQATEAPPERKQCVKCSALAGAPVSHEERQLVHSSFEMFLTRIAKYNDPHNEEWDWGDVTDKWERHAFSAFRDLLDALRENDRLRTTYDADDYVAWCTHERDEGEPDLERIVLCDSDTKGAFKVYRHPDAELTNLRDALRSLPELIPTNWLDSLLTGPDAVIGQPPYSGSDVEALLRGVKKRIEGAAINAARGEG